MYIQLDHLAGELEKRLSVHAYNLSAQIVTGIELLPWDFNAEKDVLRQDIAYVCEYRKLREYDFHLELAPLICVLERDTQVHDVFFRNRTVITVGGGTVPDILSALIDIVYEQGRNSSRLTELSRMLTQCRTEQELIDVGFEILGNPMVVTDENQQILAYTDVDRISAASYRRIVEMGHMLIGHPQPDNTRESFEPVDYPFYEGAVGDLPAILCKRLSVAGRTEGYLHILQFNRAIVGTDGPTAELLGNLLAIVLSARPRDWGQDSRYRETERFLRELLDNGGEEDYIEQKKAQIGIRLQPNLYSVVIQNCRVAYGTRTSLYELAHQLADLLPGCYGFLYRNSVFLLLNQKEEIIDFPAFFAPVLPLFKEYGLTAGVSNVFHSLKHIQEHGFQSRKAQQLGTALRKEELIYLYRDYSVYYMVELCLKNERLDALFVPELQKIMDAGEKDGGELVETLRAYLRCGRSKSQTARELFIHLNTVKYRLAQIQEKMGIDLDNDDNALRLMLSFKMLEYSDIFQHYEPMNR